MNILDYINRINEVYGKQEPRTMAQEPRNMAQASLAEDLEPGALRDEMLKGFDPSQETHEEYLQRINLERPFNAAQGGSAGQLVRNTADGSRPGYGGKGYSWSEDRGAWRVFLKRGDKEIKKYVYPKNFDGSKKKAEQSVIKELNKWKTDNPIQIDRPLQSADVIDDYKLSNWLKENKDFDFANSTVEDIVKKSKTSLSKSAVTKYLRNLDLTNPKFDPLPKEIQKEIKFKFANDYKGTWDFDKYKYGFSAGVRGDKNNRTYDNIRRFVNKPKAWRYGGAGLHTPEGWMLAQMDRAWRNGNKNYKPIYRTINNQKKIVGFIDKSEAGKGKKYISAKEFIKGSDADGVLFTEHGHYENTKKFNNIARKVHGSPSKVITDILSKGGIEMFTEKGGANVKMKHVLNYLIDTKGLDKTIGGLVRHHKAGAYGSPTSDYQILNKIINSRISGIEGRIRADQILPEDIAKLKKWGASVTHKGVTYGGGPKTAIGGLREIENLILKGSTDVELYGKKIKGIEKWNKKDFTEFNKYLQSFCGYGKSTGGRIGFKTGSCSPEVAKRNFLLATNDVRAGRVTGEAAEQIAKNAGKVVAKAGSKSALATIFGPAGILLDVAYEVGSVGWDVAKGKPWKEAIQDNWIMGAFVPGTGSEEFHKRLAKINPGAAVYGQAQDLIIAYDKKANQIERLKADNTYRGQALAKEQIPLLEKQMKEIENNYVTLTKDSKAMEEGSPEHESYMSAVTELRDSDRAKSWVGSGIKRMDVRPDRYKPRGAMEIDYSLPKPPVEISQTPLDADQLQAEAEFLRNYGLLEPRGEMPQWYIDELQQKEKWRQLFEQPGIRGTQDWRGAGGGMVGIRRPSALPPTGGPMSQGLRSLYNNVKKS